MKKNMLVAGVMAATMFAMTACSGMPGMGTTKAAAPAATQAAEGGDSAATQAAEGGGSARPVI
mgnify:CR=1 FL=1